MAIELYCVFDDTVLCIVIYYQHIARMIYFDNNSTTNMPKEVCEEMVRWMNKGNPSSSYASAIKSREMMNQFKEYIGRLSSVNICCKEDRDVDETNSRDSYAAQSTKRLNPNNYKVIFTSGATESNCTIVRSCIEAYEDATGKIPHLVVSAVEHRSIIDIVRSYVSRDRATVSYVNPTTSGHILAEDVAKCITSDTCLVCVMHANNETGAVNDIVAISKASHARNVPIHCDTVQTYGKTPIIGSDVDSFTISFHKMGGPPGIGCLVIRQKFLIGFKLQPCMFGTQNESLRGGTENLLGIGASYKALQLAMTDRNKKNEQLSKMRIQLMVSLAKIVPIRTYTQYVKDGQRGFEIVFVVDDNCAYLMNTLFLSIIKPAGEPICNTQIKNELEKQGIIVSIGSSCNTASKSASHVLVAMNADTLFKKGALRISLGDANTPAEVDKFCKVFGTIIQQLRK